ncbi:hypothetical protein [Kroppenstedtia guangzhouensis]|uniref:hypothetical protein n=1 Tax=Kroppenstedtia guangzhouensis TaxID=1274356 RepID=UPI00166431FE|nr:hypothetical protein [Kroppenstedtia guangzhouensis]
MRDRFVGLHAGAVVTDNNQAMLFIGPSGSGKTTSTSVLVNSHSCHLLTDETVFIHRRTSLVEPFHREIRAVQPDPETGVLKKKSIHVDVFYDSVYTQPVPATHGVFLEPGSYAGIRPIYPAEALKRLIDNHLYLGCDYDEALVTLGLLAKDLSFVVLNYKTYDQLISMAPQTLKIHRQQKLV